MKVNKDINFTVIKDYNSKVLELASELADIKIIDEGCTKIFELQSNGDYIYSGEAQDIFNECYELYEDRIRKIFES